MHAPPSQHQQTARARWNHGLAAAALAIAMLFVAHSYATRVAGSADSFGYLSQADLWLAGNLKVSQPFAAEVPWPIPGWTFSPLGYRPAIGALEKTAIVPVYSPGLPLLFATAKFLGGQDAMFWVVPLAAALLVLTTFGIGLRLASPAAAVIGAWLVATSPAVLFMAMWPMSDVPAAAVWALAFFFVLGDSWRSAAIAGIVAGIATPVRPNLAPLAVVLGSYYVLGALPRATRRRELVRGLTFALGALAGVVFVGVLFADLYGSPFSSGYGRLRQIYSPWRIAANARNYFVSLMSSQTPIALAGLAAVLLPAAGLWPAAPNGRARFVAAAFVVTLWLLYLPYLVFEEWWYLRFLLGTWPLLMLGTGTLASWMLERVRRPLRWSLVGAVVLLGLAHLAFAVEAHVFELWQEEARYPVVAEMVRRHTESDSVIFAMQESGGLRYYGGRMTLRFDLIEDGWFDPTVEWLEARGVHPYWLLEDWEIKSLPRNGLSPRATTALARPPLAAYDARASGHVSAYLYDLAPKAGEPPITEQVPESQSFSNPPPPVPSPRLVFR